MTVNKQEILLGRALCYYENNIGDHPKRNLLISLTKAAISGGLAINEIKRKNKIEIFSKEGNKVSNKNFEQEKGANFVTEADLACHTAITKILGKESFQGIPLVFEESNSQSTAYKAQTYISIDELDGTGSLIRGEPGAMVLLQYIYEGEPELSVNFDPSTERIFYAIKGIGSFINHEKITSKNLHTLKTAKIILNGRDKRLETNKEYWDYMKQIFGDKLDAGLATGSRIANILLGTYDVFINTGADTLREWDLGMILNLIEAGGVATRKDGTPLDFSSNTVTSDLVCSNNKKLHNEILQFLKTSPLK